MEQLLQNLSMKLYENSFTNRILRNSWYSYVALADKERIAPFLNYGYHDPEAALLPLSQAEEEHRYSIQLYHHVASGIDIGKKEVLEVGCGKGGGARYLAKAHDPARYIGSDLNRSEIRFAAEVFSEVKNLSFKVADAHELPFEDASFEAIINIESSHHYHNFRKFLSEAKRVLRKDGHLLMACYRTTEEIDELEYDLKTSGLALIREEDITQNVVLALEKDSYRRKRLVESAVPRAFRRLAEDFAGVTGSDLFNAFESREWLYKYYILKK